MRTHNLSPSQVENIVHTYETQRTSCNALSRQYGVAQGTIARLLRKHGLHIFRGKPRKYTLNEHFFDKIDTEEKAYWLGWMYSDGYNNEKRGCFVLALGEVDVEILEKFRIAIGSNAPFVYDTSPSRINPNSQNVYRFSITCRRMSERLADLGCDQKKSLTLKFPTENQVPAYLRKAFMLGFYDGDGCLCLHKKGPTWAMITNVVSTPDFCQEYARFVHEATDINHYINRQSKVKAKTLQFSGTNQSIAFLKWLYKDASIYLKRKHDLFLEGLERIKGQKRKFDRLSEKTKQWVIGA